MSQTGGGSLLQFFHALNQAETQEKFDDQLQQLRKYIDRKKGDRVIDGVLTLRGVVSDAQIDAKTQEEQTRLYNEIWKYYSGENPFVPPQQSRSPETVPLLSLSQSGLDQIVASKRECDEKLAAALERIRALEEENLALYDDLEEGEERFKKTSKDLEESTTKSFFLQSKFEILTLQQQTFSENQRVVEDAKKFLDRKKAQIESEISRLISDVKDPFYSFLLLENVKLFALLGGRISRIETTSTDPVAQANIQAINSVTEPALSGQAFMIFIQGQLEGLTGERERLQQEVLELSQARADDAREVQRLRGLVRQALELSQQEQAAAEEAALAAQQPPPPDPAVAQLEELKGRTENIEREIRDELLRLEGAIAEALTLYNASKTDQDTNVGLEKVTTSGKEYLFLLGIKRAYLRGLGEEEDSQEYVRVQTELQAIEAKVKQKLRDCDVAMIQLAESRGQCALLQEQFTTSLAEISTNITRLRSENVELSALVTRLRQIDPETAQARQAEFQQIRQQVEAALSNPIGGQVAAQFGQVQRIIGELSTGFAAQQQGLSQLTARTDLGGQVTQLQQQLGPALASFEESVRLFGVTQAELSAVRTEYEGLKLEVGAGRERLAACSARVDLLQAEKVQREAEVRALTASLAGFQAQVAQAQQARQFGEQEQRRLTAELQAKEVEKQNLAGQVAEQTQRTREIEAQLRAGRGDVEQLRRALVAAAEANQNLESSQVREEQALREIQAQVAATNGAVRLALDGEAALRAAADAQAGVLEQARREAAAAAEAARLELERRLAAQTADFEARLVREKAELRAQLTAIHDVAVATARRNQAAAEANVARQVADIQAAAAAAGAAQTAAANRAAADAARDLAAAQAAAVAAQAAAVAAANAAAVVAQAAAVAAAVAAETARLTGEIPNIANAVAASEVPGGVPVAGANPFEIALIAAIEAAKQRRHVVDQQEIDRIQAILDWHTGVDVVFNPPLPAGPVPFGTTLTFTLANRRDGHAAVFFEYPRGIEYVDVQNDNPKRYVVREGLINYGVFNVF